MIHVLSLRYLQYAKSLSGNRIFYYFLRVSTACGMREWWPYCDTCDNLTSDSIVNEMHICSSPPNSNHSNSDGASHTSTGAEGNVWWLLADEAALIDFLIANKDKAGDVLSFKQSVWNVAAEHLPQVTKKGGPKTAGK